MRDTRIASALRRIQEASRKGDRKALKSLNAELRALVDVRGNVGNWSWTTEKEPDWGAIASPRIENITIERFTVSSLPPRAKRKRSKVKAALVRVVTEAEVKPRRKLDIAGIEEVS